MIGNSRLFFSLRWKLAILFGCVFLILQSLFAFFSYKNAQDNFESDRKNIQVSSINIAETLTKDSFLVLEQFAELVSALNDPLQEAQGRQNPVSSLDGNWSRWQLIWDIENSAFIDRQGKLVKSWGKHLIDPDDKVRHVLSTEIPEHRVFCPDNCYQQAIVPVLGKSDVIGVFSVIRSFSDVIIKYCNATNSDVGVLVADPTVAGKANALQSGEWKVKLSGMTRPEKNLPVFGHISQHYEISDFFSASKRIEFGGAVYEVRILPIQQATGNNKPPYFLFIDDISKDIGHLNDDLKRIWLYSVTGLMASLLLILLALHVSLKPITRLSKALPLLSTNDFDQFRNSIPTQNSSGLGYDELDALSFTALNLADQLEHLEQEMRAQTFSLMEKSQELAKERDFIKQLIELAPIIIIIQKLNGIILTINHAGVDGLETDSRSIIGKVFDIFLPESDQEHLKKLDRLRSGQHGDQIQLDGLLMTETGKVHDFSWLHKLLPPKQQGEEPVILTLGLDISERKNRRSPEYQDGLLRLPDRPWQPPQIPRRIRAEAGVGQPLRLPTCAVLSGPGSV